MFPSHRLLPLVFACFFLCLFFPRLPDPTPTYTGDQASESTGKRENTTAKHSNHVPTFPRNGLKTFQKSEFHRTIVDNNLFRRLGWTLPRPRDFYRLLGTRTPTDGKSEAQAILQSTTARSTYTVSLGETLDTDTTVTDIQPKQVTLEKASVRRTLHLNATPLLK